MKYTPHTVWIDTYKPPAQPAPKQLPAPHNHRWMRLREVLTAAEHPIDIDSIVHLTGWTYHVAHYSLGCLKKRHLLIVQHVQKISMKGHPRALYKCNAV